MIIGDNEIKVIFSGIYHNEYNTMLGGEWMFARQFMKKQIQVLKEKKGFLIDVRTKEEYEEGHIPNAINVPMEEIENRFEEEYPDKEKFYGFYCHSGGRSEAVSSFLSSLGYTNAINIGGIISWSGEVEKTI